METLAVILLLVVSIYLIRSGSIAINKRLGFKVILVLFLMGSFSVVVMMEEISWGQRIFGWETSESFKELNTQDETNIHNAIFLKGMAVEHIFTLLLSLVVYISIILRNRIPFMAIQSLLPSEKYFYQPSIFFFLSLFRMNDNLVESIIYLFLFFHSRDIFNFYLLFQVEKKNAA